MRSRFKGCPQGCRMNGLASQISAEVTDRVNEADVTVGLREVTQELPGRWLDHRGEHPEVVGPLSSTCHVLSLETLPHVTIARVASLVLIIQSGGRILGCELHLENRIPDDGDFVLC